MGKHQDRTLMHVSKPFREFVSHTKTEIKIKTGKELSDADITTIYAIFRPTVQIPEKKKKNSIFDF